MRASWDQMTRLQVQSTADVVEKDLAKVSTVGQVVREVDLAAERDVPAEFVPSGQTLLDRPLQGL